MTQTSRCLVCASGRREEADTALQAGRSYPQVAALIGVSKDSVSRHSLNGHVRPKPGGRRNAPTRPRLPASQRLGPEASAYEHAQRIVADLAAVDMSKLSPREQSAHAETYRRAVDSLGRLQPTGSGQASDAERMVELLKAMLAVQDEAIDAAVATLTGPETQMQFRQALAASMHGGLAVRDIRTRGSKDVGFGATEGI